MDAFLIALPGLLLTSVSALPLGLGTLAAARHMPADTRSNYFRNLNASIAAGTVVLFLLWGSLFGEDLSSSSTAALIFVFAPIYSAAAQGIVYGITAVTLRKSGDPEAISSAARRAIVIPVCMFALLMAGLLKISAEGNDLAVAERSANPQVLHHLFEQSRSGEADAFGVPLFLAQNPNTPPEILVELAKHTHPAVRVHVAQHPMTPNETVAGLSNDCSSFVRKSVENRLGPNNALQPTRARTGVCAADR
jgi:hypothetical protein